LKVIRQYILTTMKMAKALPLVRGSLYTSARIPATIAMGELANAPQKKRKINKAGQVGARAQAIVKTVKRQKVTRLRSLRP
jgi:hypothetical protein